MSYTRVNWQDAPSVSTPLSASNLNKMDAGIKQNADDIEQLQQHTYDAELDSTSTNAPQTKAVYEALQRIDIETDPTLSVSGKAADAAATGEAVAQVKSQLNEISEVVPEDYASNISASDVIIGTSTLTATITGDTSNGLLMTTTSGTNGTVAIPLSRLPYTDGGSYTIRVHLDNAVTPVNLDIRRGVSTGSPGIVISSMDDDGNGNYSVTVDLGAYNYASYGIIYIGYQLRYNQTTAVTLTTSAIVSGETLRRIIKLSALEDIGMNNMSDAFKTVLNTVINGYDDIAETAQPINYTAISASDAVIGSTALVGNVTIADVETGCVSLVNSSGANGNIGFRLSNLPYSDSYTVDFIATVSNAVSPIAISLRRSMGEENPGVSLATFTDNGDGTYSLTYDLSQYNYATYGDLYLNYNLRYNQTSVMSLSLVTHKTGETEKTVVKNSALINIGIDNLTPELQNALSDIVVDKPTSYTGTEICTFNTGVAIGDSLTAGVFNHNEGGSTEYATYPQFSFPAKIEQMSGIGMTNLGNGGYTSVQWWNAHQNDDLSGKQFAIIQLGVNDAIQYNAWTQDSITAFTNIINKLLSENNGIFVFVSTIIPATSYSGASYDAVSQGIRDLVASINNSHVILLDMAQYGNTKNSAAYNNGHLSALGYEQLAQDYINYISYVMAHNLILFRNIQFIGTEYSYT